MGGQGPPLAAVPGSGERWVDRLRSTVGKTNPVRTSGGTPTKVPVFDYDPRLDASSNVTRWEDAASTLYALDEPSVDELLAELQDPETALREELGFGPNER